MKTFKLCAFFFRVVAAQFFIWTLVRGETGWSTALTLAVLTFGFELLQVPSIFKSMIDDALDEDRCNCHALTCPEREES